jgi:hypothetical protein
MELRLLVSVVVGHRSSACRPTDYTVTKISRFFSVFVKDMKAFHRCTPKKHNSVLRVAQGVPFKKQPNSNHVPRYKN